MYTAKEIESITKHLAQLGITDEAEVNAVLTYIHQAACIAIREYKSIRNEKQQNNQPDAA